MAIDSKEKMGYPTLVSATVRCGDIAWIGRIRNAKVAGSTPVSGTLSNVLSEMVKRSAFLFLK